MKARDAEILIIPGYEQVTPDSWLIRWQRKLSTAQLIEQNWRLPDKQTLLAPICDAIDKAQGPVIFIAHCLGVFSALAAAEQKAKSDKIKGAFFVAPSRFEVINSSNKMDQPLPWQSSKFFKRLSFPSCVVASSNDPFLEIEEAKHWAHLWGALFLHAGDSGHICETSGHGPWPEGLLVFSKFLSGIKTQEK